MRVKRANFIFGGLFVLNFLLAVLVFPNILPAKYYYDANTISTSTYEQLRPYGSYGFSWLFYHYTGLRYCPYWLVSLIQYPIMVYLLYKIGIPSNFHKINIKNILVYLVFFMMAIFISMPSKEFITFIYLTSIPLVFQSQGIGKKYKVIISLALLTILGSFFRIYFALIPIIAVGMFLTTFIKFRNKTVTTIFYGILITIFLSLSYGVVKGEFLSEPRQEVNSHRVNSSDANTMIITPIKPNTWYGEAIAIIYGFFAVNIPLEGFKFIFSPQVILFIFWQLLILYILFVRLRKCLRDRNKNVELLWVLLILFSYFIVQGIFEPDLGTATRHKVGVFPLIYFALYYEHFRKELH